MVEATADRFTRIDILVNNAAVFATLKPQRLRRDPGSEWDRVMAVNVKGVWNSARGGRPRHARTAAGASSTSRPPS